jgi:hypothetical protein
MCDSIVHQLLAENPEAACPDGLDFVREESRAVVGDRLLADEGIAQRWVRRLGPTAGVRSWSSVSLDAGSNRR